MGRAAGHVELFRQHAGQHSVARGVWRRARGTSRASRTSRVSRTSLCSFISRVSRALLVVPRLDGLAQRDVGHERWVGQTNARKGRPVRPRQVALNVGPLICMPRLHVQTNGLRRTRLQDLEDMEQVPDTGGTPGQSRHTWTRKTGSDISAIPMGQQKCSGGSSCIFAAPPHPSASTE